MLTRIRNANIVRSKSVDVPASNIKKELARLLKEGYILSYELIDDRDRLIPIQLKFNRKDRIITGLKRISKRAYTSVEKDQIPSIRRARHRHPLLPKSHDG